jgi:hypothetical protein
VADLDLIGTVGYLTVPVTLERPGEVLLRVRGGTEGFSAYSDQPLAKNARVIVIEARSARSLIVAPFP